MPAAHLDLRPLRYFLAVADAGQLTLAAAQLGIQQPPLSQQIQALERQLGLRLFERHPKGVRLTDAGRALADEARRLVDDADALLARMRALARGDQGSLRLAFTSSAAAHAFTPETLRECRQRLPGVVLTIVGERNAAEVSDDLLAGRLHAGFLREPVVSTEQLATLTLLSEPMVAAVPRDHPLAARRRLALADFEGQPMILVRRPGGQGLYGRLLTRCAQEGVTPVVVAEVERMMSGLNLVAAGVGLCVVPSSMQGAHAQAIVYRPLVRAAGLEAPLTLVWRADRCHGALARFIDLVRELAANRR